MIGAYYFLKRVAKVKNCPESPRGSDNFRYFFFIRSFLWYPLPHPLPLPTRGGEKYKERSPLDEIHYYVRSSLDERLDWLRNLAVSGSPNTLGGLFLLVAFLLDKQKKST